MRLGILAAAAVAAMCLAPACKKDGGNGNGKEEVEVFVANRLSINDADPVTYETGHLGELLSGKSVIALKWTDISRMNAADVMALKSAKASLVNVDMAKVRFVEDETTYEGYSSKNEHVKPDVLPQSILDGFKNLKTAVLPEKVLGLGSCSLSYCEALVSCILPPKLEYMDRYCFSHCKALKSITLPDTFKEMKQDSNFQYCSALESFSFPDATTGPGSTTLLNCTSLKSLHYGARCPSSKILPSIALGCSNLETLTVSKDNKNVVSEDDVLLSADKKTLLFQPYACPDGNYIVKGYPTVNVYLWNNSGYTSIAFAEGVEKINYTLFRCANVTKITLPSTVRELRQGELAPSGFTALRTLEVRSTTPPTIDTNLLGGLAMEEIRVPASAVDAYKADSHWGMHASKIKAI